MDDLENPDSSSDPPALTEIKCARCPKVQTPEDFPILKKGKNKGQRNKSCSGCMDKRRTYNKERAPSESPLPASREQEALPIQSLTSFLGSLTLRGVYDLKARVDVRLAPTLGTNGEEADDEAKAKASATYLAAQISEVTGYRLV